MLEQTSEITPALLRRIEEVVWGFEAGVCYQIYDRKEMLERLVPPGHFLLLQNQTKLLGTLFCLPKSVSLGNSLTASALYESVLSVVPEEHGKGLAKQMVEQAAAFIGPRGFEYAYVEEKNIPSAAAFKTQGFEPIGQFHAITLNRLRPRSSSRVSLLGSDTVNQIRRHLHADYLDHALVDLEISLLPEFYWIIRDKGVIVAGVQIEQERWAIRSMPGPDGWFAVHVLPRIPFLRDILNPANIPVLKIGNLWVAPGHETAFMELVEHLTHIFKKKLALMYLDKRSPIYQRLKKSISFGVFNTLFETPVQIWARFKGFEEPEIAALKKRPFVISPLDIS